MPSERRTELLLNRAVRAHADSADRHEAAAAMWDQRGHAEWAAFARRCAEIEREVAQLAEARLELMRLRERPGAEGAEAEAERLRENIRRRSEQLRRHDASAERERVRLREARRIHDDESPSSPADPEEREWLSDEREWLADVRERSADEREQIADEREQIADERERNADEREGAGGAALDADQERSARTHERKRRDQARALRKDGQSERASAAAGREAWRAEWERKTARPNAADRAIVRVRAGALQLARLLTRTAEALEKTAELADAHAERHQQLGRPGAAKEEQAVAARARQAARRARWHAQEWSQWVAPQGPRAAARRPTRSTGH